VIGNPRYVLRPFAPARTASLAARRACQQPSRVCCRLRRQPRGQGQARCARGLEVGPRPPPSAPRGGSRRVLGAVVVCAGLEGRAWAWPVAATRLRRWCGTGCAASLFVGPPPTPARLRHRLRPWPIRPPEGGSLWGRNPSLLVPLKGISNLYCRQTECGSFPYGHRIQFAQSKARIFCQPKHDSRMSQLSSTMEQDRAAGGLERRKMRTKSGDVVIVSLAIGSSKDKSLNNVTMRFKMGGLTVSRLVGNIEGGTRGEILKNGWAKIRSDKIAEQNQWSWVSE